MTDRKGLAALGNSPDRRGAETNPFPAWSQCARSCRDPAEVSGKQSMATILVVDDEPGIIDVLTVFLQDEGHVVISATNGREALARSAEICPNLVISDYRMPEMDGISFLCALRALPAAARIPFILTSSVPESMLRIGFDPGEPSGYDYDAFIAKPFRLHVVADCVSRLLKFADHPRTRAGDLRPPGALSLPVSAARKIADLETNFR
jgi:two-component system, OmpR family, response regulator VicR